MAESAHLDSVDVISAKSCDLLRRCRLCCHEMGACGTGFLDGLPLFKD
jgi:hypothetical protein